MELSTGTIEAHCMSDSVCFLLDPQVYRLKFLLVLCMSVQCMFLTCPIPRSRHWESSGLAMELSTHTIEAYCCMSVCL